MSGNYPSHNGYKQSWYSFIQGGYPGDEIRKEVLESWQRCKKAGLSPYLTAAAKVDKADLEQRLIKNAALIQTSKPLIHHLYKFLAGSGFVVALADNEGVLLHVIGDEDALQASHGNLAVGANWSETSVGTNSMGTPLYRDAPCQYWGFEHFCRLPQHWAGAGAPIHDPEGGIVGCLNISGEIERSHLHTLGMAVITAQAIGIHLKLKQAINHSIRVNQHQDIIINAMSEGMVILNEDFSVALANQYITKRLNTSAEALLGCPIGKLCSDQHLLKTIQCLGEVIDYITELHFSEASYACTVTCKSIGGPSTKPETLLLISDVIRAKKLARRLSASEAMLTFHDIVGEDMQLHSVISLAKAAAETSANVLILGESGTGKEVFAQAIHSGSPRADGPFIAINCAAIPRELVASTLFGYEEGAFTGAKRGGSPGKFELADQGTLFLDEIAELPLDIQAVLLRVLETKSFTRVGGKDTVSVDVRIISATNRDLLHESQVNHFRLDLYYRLNVFSIYLSPLRERRGDIPLLANYFLSQMSRRYQRNTTRLSDGALGLLSKHDWPGNIRELQNTIERSVVMSGDTEISSRIIALCLPAPAVHSVGTEFVRCGGARAGARAGNMEEREQLERVLEECRWNISKAALRLGIARSTLYRKIYYFNLKNYE